MDEAKLRTVAQLQEFLDATQEVTFTGAPGEGDQQRYVGPAQNLAEWSDAPSKNLHLYVVVLCILILHTTTGIYHDLHHHHANF